MTEFYYESRVLLLTIFAVGLSSVSLLVFFRLKLRPILNQECARLINSSFLQPKYQLVFFSPTRFLPSAHLFVELTRALQRLGVDAVFVTGNTSLCFGKTNGKIHLFSFLNSERALGQIEPQYQGLIATLTCLKFTLGSQLDSACQQREQTLPLPFFKLLKRFFYSTKTSNEELILKIMLDHLHNLAETDYISEN